MTREEARTHIIAHWVMRADQSLAAARDELSAERIEFAVNRVYYACFYALSALLLKDGRRFVKHRGVRAAMHQHLVKTGELGRPLADFYDQMFAARHEADYGESPTFAAGAVELYVEQGEQFVAEIRKLLARRAG
jgi:uncharacterized protein (UPF0332 family)